MGKIIGAALVAIAVLLFSASITKILYRPGNPKVYDSNLNKVDARGYAVGEAAKVAGDEEDEGEFIFALALHEADPAAGAKVFKKCAACHTTEKGGADKVGPNLYGIVNRAKADGGFAYSEALKGLGGAWTYDDLFAFLSKPKDYVPGTKMAFAGLRKPNDAAKLIVYLRTLSDNPAPLPPKPEITEEAPAEDAAADAEIH